VNLQGGRTRDGGSIVGASVFYTTSRPEGEEKGEGEMPEKTTCTEVEKLDRELKVFVQSQFHPVYVILKNGGNLLLQNEMTTYQTTKCRKLDDHSLNTHHHENLEDTHDVIALLFSHL
jgi:hypothetical protein